MTPRIYDRDGIKTALLDVVQQVVHILGMEDVNNNLSRNIMRS